MRGKIAAVSLLSMLIPFLGLRAAPAGLADLARRARSGSPAESTQAVAALRQAGPAGMEAMLAACGNGSCGDVLDRVCGVRDCADIRLFWYTDLDAAKAAAKASGKPILSLRLMGRLDEELSCANSRFFRTVLYANTDVSKYLRENFILHWKSVRPAPRVTIDFGDGRKLERTITGNSIHYILDEQGRIVDALPGLYGPTAFLRELKQGEAVARQIIGQEAAKRAQILRSYANARLDAVNKAWAADVEKVGGRITEKIDARTATPNNPPSARAASRMAMTKAVTENGIVNAITYDTRTLQRMTDEETWNKIAALYLAE